MGLTSRKRRSSIHLGVGVKILGTLFLGAFLAGGIFFAGLLGKEFWKQVQTYRWQKTDAEVLSSEVVEEQKRENPYRFSVSYRYRWKGLDHVSEQVSVSGKRFSDYRKAQRIADDYPAGATVTCYVNRANPRQAVLLRGEWWMGIFMIIPLVFIMVGGGGIVALWRMGKSSDAITHQAPSGPMTQRGRAGKKVAFLFFLTFFLAGSGFLYGFFIRPALKIMASKDWPAVQCVVESSQVRSHRSDDGTTYSVDILYRYRVNDREYKSNQYDFMGGSSSGQGGKRAIVMQHPKGRETVCYVNPDDPTDAVLNREFGPDMWFGLIPMIFVIVGLVGLVYSARARDHSSPASVKRREPGRRADGSGTTTGGPMVLKARQTRWGKMIMITLFALFWNGIISIFLWQAIKAWQRPRAPFMEKWFLPIFLIPFLVIGVILIVSMISEFLALFNPRVRLTVSTGRICPGKPFSLEWHVTGKVHRLQALIVYLEGCEECTYRRGTRTYTDTSVFAKVDLASVTSRSDLRHGRTEVAVPAGTMPTFEAPHNRILWNIHVKGEIKQWPDVADEFSIQVLPRGEVEGS